MRALRNYLFWGFCKKPTFFKKTRNYLFSKKWKNTIFLKNDIFPKMTLLQKTPFSIKVAFSKKTDFFRKPHFGGILGGGQNRGQKRPVFRGVKKGLFSENPKKQHFGVFWGMGQKWCFWGIYLGRPLGKPHFTSLICHSISFDCI